MAEFAAVRDAIVHKLTRAAMPPRFLMSRFRFIEERSRYSRACLDPLYLLFYYYLGRHFPAGALLDVGFGIGLNSALYLTGCPGVGSVLAVQEPTAEYYSPRLGRANLKQAWPHRADIHVGYLHDDAFLAALRARKWDVVLMSEKRGYDTHMLWFDTIWENVSDGGVVFVDHTTTDATGRAYRDFCRIRNREPFVFPTRYGVGAVEK